MYAEALLNLASKINTVSLAFIFLLGLVVYILFQVQKRKDFDFAEMLKTDGKPSASRLGMLLSLAISSWVVVSAAMTDLTAGSSSSRLSDILGLYLGVFAGVKVLEKGIDTWGKSNTLSRDDFKETRQPDFAETVPMSYDSDVKGRM